MTNVQHSSRNDSWGTPPDIIARVRTVLGGIDFDPASSTQANLVVKARHFLRADGLDLTLWPTRSSRVYINPPGGTVLRRSHPALFWQALMQYRDRGLLEHGIFACFSIESLAVFQNYHTKSPLDFVVCVPRKRVKWVHPTQPKKSPSHANAFVYVYGNVDYTGRFTRVFGDLGLVTDG